MSNNTPYKKNYSVVISGATGLVGQALVKQLILDELCQNIIVLARRQTAFVHDKIHFIQTDFTNIHQLDLPKIDENSQIDYAFCCLGTTKKKAGSQYAFQKVDYYYVVEFAKLIQRSGVKHLGVISSVGADKPLGFYLKTKARMEADVKALNLLSLAIFRPSILLGEREEFRFGEKLGEKIMTSLTTVFSGRLSKYKPVAATQLAKVMLAQAKKDKKETITLGSKAILTVQ